MTTVSTKPYLLRAIHEWCVDQGFTPHIAVLVDAQTIVPPGYARDGQIVLNVGPEATHQLLMGNERITFQGRFGGVAHALSIPVQNVIAIYARENGQGMAFEPDAADAETDADADADAPTENATPELTSIEGGQGGDGPDDGPEPPETPPSGKRPRLKLVK